jgi:formylglycine-generating enzyme required for sulfatase activity
MRPQHAMGAIAGLAIGILGCAQSPGGPASDPKTPGSDDRAPVLECSFVGATVELATVAWDAKSRAELAAALEVGAAIVRFRSQGCKVTLELLRHCVGTPSYSYQPFSSAKTRSEIVHDQDELSIKLPLGAERVSGKVGGERALRADSVLVGEMALPPGARLHLAGPDCGRATHVVRKAFLGGFSMVAGASQALSGGASVFLLGDFGPTRQVETLSREGDPAKCEQAARQGTKLPRCAVPIRIQLAPLHVCPEGSPWDGTQCTPAKPGTVSDQPAPTATGSMVRISAATVPLGSNDRLPGDRLSHTETVSSFEIDVNEVTVAEYDNCVRAGHCREVTSDRACNRGKPGLERHPINCLDLEEATAYCAWAGKRLPTPEEWEYAARGTDGRTYPWGNAPPKNQLCWDGEGNDLGKGNRRSTCPVGSYPSGDSPFGLRDMAGNVWEFTVSRDGKRSEIRGGGWSESQARYVRTMESGSFTWRAEFTGFRCARSG